MHKSQASKAYFSGLIQQTNLEKLKCTKCNKYLSKFPIHRTFKGDVICGRCPLSANLEVFRDELYETAVEFQMFPCVNRELGCLEVLFPSETATHEQRCPYMKYKCPTSVYNNCTWEASLDKLLNHFHANHPTFLLKEGKFEIDFVNNHCENYLMPYGDDLYIVTRECISKSKIFSILVQYIGSQSDIDKYMYTVTLENGNKSHQYSIDQRVGTKLDLEGQIISQKLHDPVTIVAKISIKPVKEEMKAETYNTGNYDSFEEKLRNVECPVCLNYMLPPIFQCVTGHSICEPCMRNQSVCPTCFQRYENTRNLALEDMVLTMIYPCSHNDCTFRTQAKNIKKHEATCIYASRNCPLKEFENCSELLPGAGLLNHIRQKHFESLLELDTVSLPFDSPMEEDFMEEFILPYRELLFKICFMYQAVDKKFFWSVQFIGPTDNHSKYNYELEIIDVNGKNRRMYFKSRCNMLMNKDETFRDGNRYIYLHYDQISKFIKYQLTYRILISKIPNLN